MYVHEDSLAGVRLLVSPRDLVSLRRNTANYAAAEVVERHALRRFILRAIDLLN